MSEFSDAVCDSYKKRLKEFFSNMFLEKMLHCNNDEFNTKKRQHAEDDQNQTAKFGRFITIEDEANELEWIDNANRKRCQVDQCRDPGKRLKPSEASEDND